MAILNASSARSAPLTFPSQGSGSDAFAEGFFTPLLACFTTAQHRRACPELPDWDWLLLGVRRALEDHRSGRAFLQHLAVAGFDAPDYSHFFETLKSTRRLKLVSEVSDDLARSMEPLGTDFWKEVPELKDFDVHAGDGHFHAAARMVS